MEIKSNIRNELLKRNGLEIELEAEKNPSFNEIKKKITEEFKNPEETIEVCGIKGGFGKKKFKISAFIYDSREELEKNKRKPKQEKKKEEKPAEEAKPAEGKKWRKETSPKAKLWYCL